MRAKLGFKGVVWMMAATWLAGCSVAPSTNIAKPLTARPQAPAPVPEANGSIFQAGRGVVLFEDRRARYVGDTLTVNLVEKTSASRSSATTESRKASASISAPVPTLLGKKVPVVGGKHLIGDGTWNPAGEMNQEFKDNDANNNNITGSITVTVVEVLPNGNLVVSGEKQLALNNDTDYIRLAGVVNPMHVTASNSVQSTQLSDVQIESKNSQSFDGAQVASLMARFFLTLLPF